MRPSHWVMKSLPQLLQSRRTVIDRFSNVAGNHANTSFCERPILPKSSEGWSGRNNSYIIRKPAPVPASACCTVYCAFHSNTCKMDSANNRPTRHNHRREGGKFNPRRDPNIMPLNIPGLEEHTNQLLNNFHSDVSMGVGSVSISKWHRNAQDLIMEWAKMWGKNRNLQSHKVSQEQMHKGVSLANALAEKILEIKMKELCEKNEMNASPNLPQNQSKTMAGATGNRHSQYLNTEILCQHVALGWSRCSSKIATEGPNKAQRLLEKSEEICHRLERLSSSEKVSFVLRDVAPTGAFYNHVLSCWSRSLDPNAERHMKTLLERMSSLQGTYARPDVISYNNLLNLYAYRGDVDSAEALLKEMEQPNHNVSADVYSYTIVMNALQKRFSSSGINRDMKDPVRAEEMLSRLVKKYEKSGFQDSRLRPSHVTLGTVLSMYAAADRLLKDDVRKSTSRHWYAKHIASDSHQEGMGWGAENAERVLEWIIGLYERDKRKKMGTINANATAGGRLNERRDDAFNDKDPIIQPCAQHFM